MDPLSLGIRSLGSGGGLFGYRKHHTTLPTTGSEGIPVWTLEPAPSESLVDPHDLRIARSHDTNDPARMGIAACALGNAENDQVVLLQRLGHRSDLD